MFEIVSICKGGGYRYCRTVPPHPKQNSKGLYPLHRVLMENKIGRILLPGEEIHHIDEDKTNDSIDNLELKTKSEHSRYHQEKLAPKRLEIKCACGKIFKLKPRAFMRRISRNKSKKAFCSISCGSTNFQ